MAGSFNIFAKVNYGIVKDTLKWFRILPFEGLSSSNCSKRSFTARSVCTMCTRIEFWLHPFTSLYRHCLHSNSFTMNNTRAPSVFRQRMAKAFICVSAHISLSVLYFLTHTAHLIGLHPIVFLLRKTEISCIFASSSRSAAANASERVYIVQSGTYERKLFQKTHYYDNTHTHTLTAFLATADETHSLNCLCAVIWIGMKTILCMSTTIRWHADLFAPTPLPHPRRHDMRRPNKRENQLNEWSERRE